MTLLAVIGWLLERPLLAAWLVMVGLALQLLVGAFRLWNRERLSADALGRAYPHLSVYDNIAFPLTIANVSKSEIRRRVDEAARILTWSRT